MERSRTGFALSGAVLSPASLSAVGAKSARPANDNHTNQKLTRGPIEWVFVQHWVAERKPNRLGGANRSTEDDVWRCATIGGMRADTAHYPGADGQHGAVQLTTGRDRSISLDDPQRPLAEDEAGDSGGAARPLRPLAPWGSVTCAFTGLATVGDDTFTSWPKKPQCPVRSPSLTVSTHVRAANARLPTFVYLPSRQLAVLGCRAMTAMPARQMAPPTRSHRVGTTPSTRHSQSSATTT